MTIGLGFIGVGNHGRHHLHEFSRLTDCTPKLVCDLESEHVALAQKDFLGVASADAATLVANDEIDAVVICTPAESHRALVELALKHHKHVLIEKPLAHHPVDARAIASLADQYPEQVVMVGHCERFDRAYLDARRAVDDGEVGTPRFISASRLAPHHLNNPEWLLGPLDTAVHDIDLILWLMGDKPVSVSAHATARTQGGAWDHVTYDIRFARGSSSTAPEAVSTSISGRVPSPCTTVRPIATSGPTMSSSATETIARLSPPLMPRFLTRSKRAALHP